MSSAHIHSYSVDTFISLQSLIGIDEDFHGSKNQHPVFRARHSSAFFAGHRSADENFVSFHSTAKATAVRVRTFHIRLIGG